MCSVRNDLFTAELRYRRAAWGVAVVRNDFSEEMGKLFKRYMELEAARTTALQEASRHMTAHLAAASGGKGLSLETMLRVAEGMDTTQDYKFFERQTAGSSSASGSTKVAKAGGGGGAPADDAAAAFRGAELTSRDASEEGHSELKFPGYTLGVHSPLVVHWAVVDRQSGVLKRWKPCVAVMTVTGWLHVFELHGAWKRLATPESALTEVASYSSLPPPYLATPRGRRASAADNAPPVTYDDDEAAEAADADLQHRVHNLPLTHSDGSAMTFNDAADLLRHAELGAEFSVGIHWSHAEAHRSKEKGTWAVVEAPPGMLAFSKRHVFRSKEAADGVAWIQAVNKLHTALTVQASTESP